jgi:hypothetical protein
MTRLLSSNWLQPVPVFADEFEQSEVTHFVPEDVMQEEQAIAAAADPAGRRLFTKYGNAITAVDKC